MMTKCLILSLLGLLLVCTAQADTKCNLRAIFRTPRRSNYDEFELMERSSFPSEEPKNRPVEPNLPNTFSNARVLLRLGDYRNAVKKNNNNVNTKITLAGPNHNNYYQPPFVHPYYPPPMGYPWHLYYPSPRIPQYTPQYYYVNTPRFIPQYPIPPPEAPIMSSYHVPAPQPLRKPKIVINDPILLDNSVIQHIPIASIQPKSSASNGLNTMTVIPKILMDSVAKQPAILDKLETVKLAEPSQQSSDNMTNTQSNPEEAKLESVGEVKAPEVQALKIEEIQPQTQNLTAEEPALVEVTPDLIQNLPKEDANQESFKIVEIPSQSENIFTKSTDNSMNLPVGEDTNQDNFQMVEISESLPSNNDSNVPDVENTINNSFEEKKEPEVVVEQEILLKDPVAASAGPIQPEVQPEASPIHNIDHPRVLHPVKLSNNIENVEIVGAGNVNISLNGNQRPTIENCPNTKDFELVNLLKKSLVPFINLKTNEEPKLLVSYPIINNVDKNIPEHPSAIIVESLRREPTFCAACSGNFNPKKKDVDIDNLSIFKMASILPQVFPDVQESSSGYSVSSSSSSSSVSSPDGSPKAVVSGYQISSASGFYEDPTQRVVYKKPTEITIVPPQLTEHVPNFIQPTLIPPSPHQQVLPVAYEGYDQPRQESEIVGRSKLVDLLKYLLANVPPTPLTHARPSVCPYCANLIRVPTVVRCPHCLNYHDVSRAYSEPEMQRSFCPHCMANRQLAEASWNSARLPPRCPYCAKYRGELNQLEA